jgi:hypothetical protein
MASERALAKAAATNAEKSDPDLDVAIKTAMAASLDVLKEQNRSKEKLAAGERGFLGGLFGGRDHAPQFIAFIAMMLGFLAFGYALKQMAGASPEVQSFWWEIAQYILTFTGTTLGFAVGKSSK